MTKELLGLVYGISVLAAVFCGVGTVLGMMMNGSRDFDLGGIGIAATIAFSGIAWLALYFAGN
jgi:hypothetical protein